MLRHSLQRIHCQHIRVKDRQGELLLDDISCLNRELVTYFDFASPTTQETFSNLMGPRLVKMNVLGLCRFFNMKKSVRGAIRKAPSSLSWVFALVNLNANGAVADSHELLQRWNLDILIGI